MDLHFKVLDIVDEAARAATAQAKITLRSLPESEGVTAALPGWTAKLIRKVKTSFETVLGFASYVGHKLKASAQWVYNLPHQVINSFASAVRTVGRAAVFAGEVILILVTALILLQITIQIYHRIWLRYADWRMKVKEQRACEEQERAHLLGHEEHERYARGQVERARKYRIWRRECDGAFQPQTTSFTHFPEPPYWLCEKDECALQNRYLKACEHSLRRLFEAAGDNLRTTLADERTRWHPNGATGSMFYRLQEKPLGPEVKKKAEELSQILQKLIDEVDGK
ncbi:hypothetical protein LTR01_009156 [Friedmanniomyces endolithicus]|nr:hypothetical protein LTR01_009156 [Friedmanniomyces endolithicus]